MKECDQRAIIKLEYLTNNEALEEIDSCQDKEKKVTTLAQISSSNFDFKDYPGQQVGKKFIPYSNKRTKAQILSALRAQANFSGMKDSELENILNYDQEQPDLRAEKANIQALERAKRLANRKAVQETI